MRQFLALSFFVALAACGGSSNDPVDAGGPDWSGTFKGPASTAGQCSDGSSQAASSDTLSLNFTRNGDQLSYTAKCGATVVADLNGNVATLRQVTCPPQTTDGGLTATLTLKSGTYTLDGNSLAVNYAEHVVYSGTATGTCDLSTTGTLARQ